MKTAELLKTGLRFPVEFTPEVAHQTDILIGAFSPLIAWRRTQINLWILLSSLERQRFYKVFGNEEDLGEIPEGEKSGFFPPFEAFLNHPLRSCVSEFNVFTINEYGICTFWHHFRHSSPTGKKEKEFFSGHYLSISLDEDIKSDLGLVGYPLDLALMVELDPNQKNSFEELSIEDQNCFFYALSAYFCASNPKFVEWSGNNYFVVKPTLCCLLSADSYQSYKVPLPPVVFRPGEGIRGYTLWLKRKWIQDS